MNNLRVLIENHDAFSGKILAKLMGCYQVQRYRLAKEIDSHNPPGMRALGALGADAGQSARWNVV
jgi:hypothetical protein